MEFDNEDKVSIEASSHLFKKIGSHDPKIISKVLLHGNGRRHPLLRLERANLGDEGLIPIVKALKQQAIVESLDISNNNVTHIGLEELVAALQVNKEIKHLKLDSNPIGDKGCTLLAKALKNNGCAIKSLYLSDCEITHIGIMALAQSLESNTNLITLHINSNKIGLEGITALTKSISLNTTIKNLSCFCCAIGDQGAIKILEYLEKTKFSLINLNIKGNKIPQVTLDKINQILLVKKEKEKKRMIKAAAKDIIDQETERMVKIKMKDVKDKAQKQLDEKLKVLGQKESDLSSKEKVLQGKQSELSTKLKEFEKKKSSSKSDSKDKSNNIKSYSKKKNEDTITIVIAGDKDLDKEQFISWGQSVIDNVKVISDSDFEKTISGDIVIEGKPVNLTFVNTSSHDRYSRLRALQYEHADAAIVVYSTSDRVSFEDISFQWLPEINFMGKIPIFISGMHSDQRCNPPKPTDVTEAEAKEFSSKVVGTSVYSEPTNPDDFRKMCTMMLKEMKVIKKSKK